MRERETFLEDHLRLWKATGKDAPRNELQSIAAWLHTAGGVDYETLKGMMRMRMVLLMQASTDLHEAGPNAEEAAKIYDEAPEMRTVPRTGAGQE